MFCKVFIVKDALDGMFAVNVLATLTDFKINRITEESLATIEKAISELERVKKYVTYYVPKRLLDDEFLKCAEAWKCFRVAICVVYKTHDLLPNVEKLIALLTSIQATRKLEEGPELEKLRAVFEYIRSEHNYQPVSSCGGFF